MAGSAEAVCAHCVVHPSGTDMTRTALSTQYDGDVRGMSREVNIALETGSVESISEQQHTAGKQQLARSRRRREVQL